MADKVVKLSSICVIEHSVRDGAVVLKMTGIAGGKSVRVEATLDSYDIPKVVEVMRSGVNSHISYWTRAQKWLGRNENG